jgi:site-specific recombinase XerD
MRLRRLASRTAESYLSWILRYIRYHDTRHPATMGETEVLAFVNMLVVDRRVAHSTQMQALSALLFLYRDVLRTPLGDLRGLVRARGPVRLPVVLTAEEVAAVMAHLRGSTWTIAALLYGSGLRLMEALTLRVKDLDFSRREIVVRRGKGGMRRRVPLTSPVRQALKAYLETQLDLKGDDLLWVGERGPLRDRTGVFNLLKKYARQAGLDPDLISPHVLRHTFATRYLTANLDDLRGLAAIMGHANLNTVMIYTEPTIADLATRMEKAEL